MKKAPKSVNKKRKPIIKKDAVKPITKEATEKKFLFMCFFRLENAK